MTDDEINRRVAEIEGWAGDLLDDFPKNGAVACNSWEWHKEGKDGRRYIQRKPPPYATDWTWCGPLLKRDIIRLEWDTSKPSRQWMALAKHGVLVIYNETPQIAICRAVIAAHEQAILANHEPPTPGPDRSPGRPRLAD